MLKSLLGLTRDVSKIVIAPIEITVDAARLTTKPLAEIAAEISRDIKKSVER